ncbi:MAG: putative nicotinate-nucleotide adenylyltransferase [Ardenticatenaceae bacterium]|nr:MAG: putative nicotinate-nucleotide adenylyltransferase [Ardenticatenaceae bacterium]
MNHLHKALPACKGQAKIGLFGGTFDPPHWGHLWLAELARVQFNLAQVLFLPVGDPVHKQGNAITAVSHRLKMVSLAIQDNPYFVLDKTDCNRPAPHTTVTLLPILQQTYLQSEFWLLMGGDSLRDLPTWAEPNELIQQCRLGVLLRPGVAIDLDSLETAVPGIKAAVDLLAGPTLSISATAIRSWVQTGQNPTYLLPTAVAKYIHQHQLYKKSIGHQ